MTLFGQVQTRVAQPRALSSHIKCFRSRFAQVNAHSRFSKVNPHPPVEPQICNLVWQVQRRVAQTRAVFQLPPAE